MAARGGQATSYRPAEPAAAAPMAVDGGGGNEATFLEDWAAWQRPLGRADQQFRPLHMKVGVLHRAAGELHKVCHFQC